MNDSEQSVYEWLMGQGFGAVVYEPDGKVPPDFLVNGRIAVEVRWPRIQRVIGLVASAIEAAVPGSYTEVQIPYKDG